MRVEHAVRSLIGRGVVGYEKIGEDEVALEVLGRGPEPATVKAYIRLTGDCCSESYFTDPDQFRELFGQTILDVEERRDEYVPKGAAPSRQEETEWAFLVFTTSAGHVTIDWRNDSNGYYGGSVVLSWEK